MLSVFVFCLVGLAAALGSEILQGRPAGVGGRGAAFFVTSGVVVIDAVHQVVLQLGVLVVLRGHAVLAQHRRHLAVALAQRVHVLDGHGQRHGVVNHVRHVELVHVRGYLDELVRVVGKGVAVKMQGQSANLFAFLGGYVLLFPLCSQKISPAPFHLDKNSVKWNKTHPAEIQYHRGEGMGWYILLGFLSAYGALSVLWASLGWLLPGLRGCAVVYMGTPGEGMRRRWRWLRGLGLVNCPFLAVTKEQTEDMEVCGQEELIARLPFVAKNCQRFCREHWRNRQQQLNV